MMIFPDDFLSGRLTASPLLDLAFAAIDVLWIRARRVDLLTAQFAPTPLIGYCYLGFGIIAFGIIAAFFGLWFLLPA